MASNDIQVFVVTYNRPDYLALQLETLAAQTAKPASITVLDDGPNPETRRVSERFAAAGIGYEHTDRPGLWGNIYEAQQRANAKYVAVFHDDDKTHPRYLELAGEAISKDPSISLIGCVGTNRSPEDDPGFGEVDDLGWQFDSRTFAASFVSGMGTHFPFYIYRTAEFKKLDVYKYLDYNGPYGKWGDSAFVLRNMHKRQRSESVNMPGESEIPRVVFEEIIVNALVHRNYFVDAPIRILVFDDRVEVISPGSLPNHLTVEKILAGNTNIRNSIIASYVARGLLPYSGLGSGIRRAQSAWQNIKFINDIEGVQFQVVIYKESVEQDSPRVTSGTIKPRSGTIKPESGTINVESGTINETIRLCPGISLIELAEKVGKSRTTVARTVANLKLQGVIEYRGSRKTGGYYIKLSQNMEA